MRVLTLAVKPAGLGGLNTAMFILHSLEKGRSRRQIAEMLKGDEELVDIWIAFLMQYDWIEQQEESGEWSVTAKGREWSEKISIKYAER